MVSLSFVQYCEGKTVSLAILVYFFANRFSHYYYFLNFGSSTTDERACAIYQDGPGSKRFAASARDGHPCHVLIAWVGVNNTDF